VNRPVLVIIVLIAISILAFVQMNRTGMFINLVRDLSGTTCGNKVCEEDETKCSCPEDCEPCSVYTGTCRRGYCYQSECLVENINNCCGNQECEIDECNSCRLDCTSEGCGVFSVELLDSSIIKGKTMDENIIIVNVNKLLTSSNFVFSIKSYDKNVKDLGVIHDCCIKIGASCNPVSSKSVWSYFFDPDNAILSGEKDSVVNLNSYGSVNYLFGFSFFDDFIPRTTSNELKKGTYYTHCKFAFQSSEPENLVVRNYDILFNVR
jgi:hypothetical protein